MKKTIIWILVAIVVVAGGYAWMEYSEVSKLQAALKEAQEVVVAEPTPAADATPEAIAEAQAAYQQAVEAQAKAIAEAQAALDAKLAKAPVSWFVCKEEACTEAAPEAAQEAVQEAAQEAAQALEAAQAPAK